MTKYGIWLFLILTLLGVTFVVAQNDDTATQSNGEWGILFQANTAERQGLYWMSADGTNIQQIISNERLFQAFNGFSNSYRLSPSGKYMALSAKVASGMPYSNDGLYILPLETNQPQRLFEYQDSVAEFPTWSPDGKHIVFCSTLIANQIDQSLKIIDVNTLEQTTVLHPWLLFKWGLAEGIPSGCASWLDNDTLIFAATVGIHGVPDIPTPRHAAVFEIETDGSNLRQITPDDTDVLFPPYGTLPVHLLNEKNILTYLCPNTPINAYTANKLCQMDLNTFQVNELANLETFGINTGFVTVPYEDQEEIGENQGQSNTITVQDNFVTQLDVAPDGRIILDILTNYPYNPEIYLYDPQTGQLTYLTQGTSPEWFYRKS